MLPWRCTPASGSSAITSTTRRTANCRVFTDTEIRLTPSMIQAFEHTTANTLGLLTSRGRHNFTVLGSSHSKHQHFASNVGQNMHEETPGSLLPRQVKEPARVSVKWILICDCIPIVQPCYFKRPRIKIPVRKLGLRHSACQSSLNARALSVALVYSRTDPRWAFN